MSAPRRTMVLVDTNIWADHLGHGHPELARLLAARQVLIHPIVIGELAVGSLSARDSTIAALKSLPQANSVSHEEALSFIEAHACFGTGVGYNDVQLLASVAITPGTQLYTGDKRLLALAKLLDLAYTQTLH